MESDNSTKKEFTQNIVNNLKEKISEFKSKKTQDKAERKTELDFEINKELIDKFKKDHTSTSNDSTSINNNKLSEEIKANIKNMNQNLLQNNSISQNEPVKVNSSDKIKAQLENKLNLNMPSNQNNTNNTNNINSNTNTISKQVDINNSNTNTNKILNNLQLNKIMFGNNNSTSTNTNNINLNNLSNFTSSKNKTNLNNNELNFDLNSYKKNSSKATSNSGNINNLTSQKTDLSSLSNKYGLLNTINTSTALSNKPSLNSKTNNYYTSQPTGSNIKNDYNTSKVQDKKAQIMNSLLNNDYKGSNNKKDIFANYNTKNKFGTINNPRPDDKNYKSFKFNDNVTTKDKIKEFVFKLDEPKKSLPVAKNNIDHPPKYDFSSNYSDIKYQKSFPVKYNNNIFGNGYKKNDDDDLDGFSDFNINSVNKDKKRRTFSSDKLTFDYGLSGINSNNINNIGSKCVLSSKDVRQFTSKIRMLTKDEAKTLDKGIIDDLMNLSNTIQMLFGNKI